jgi:hypothetical protein
MVSYEDYKIFHPEVFKVLYQDLPDPVRQYSNLFGNAQSMGLYDFSMASKDTPYKMLPPVQELEDSKAMMESQDIESYTLQEFRGHVDIPLKVIRQFEAVNNMPGAIANIKNRYVSAIKEYVENTIEYTVFKALDDKRSILSTSHDWNAGATTADLIIEDIALTQEAYQTQTKALPTVGVVNPKAKTQMLIRKDLSGKLYTGKDALITGSFGEFLGMNYVPQAGGFTDYEGNTLSMFAPTTTGKSLMYVFNPATVGYPVVFGSPKYTFEDKPSKGAIRVYVEMAAGFVYNQDYVGAITV